jgi:hypothetical protein
LKAFNVHSDVRTPADYPATSEAILHFVYYWYSFMPLARGSAAVGYTTILSLFWAFGMPISSHIPKDYQTDWEAILCRVCRHFFTITHQWYHPR